MNLPVREAAFALDAISARAAMTTGRVGERLLTHPVPCLPAETPASPVRIYTGSVAVGFPFSPVGSELVLAPWSTTRSELSVRPLTRRPPEWRAGAYWPTVHGFLDDLSRKLESIAFLGRRVGHDAVPELIATLAA